MYHVPGTWYEVYTCNGSAWMSAFAGTDISDRKVYLSVVVGKLKKGIALIMLIWRKSCLVIKHDYLLFKQVAVIKQVKKSCLYKLLIPVTMETRSSEVIFPNYSKKKPAEDTLVPPLWGTRGKNVRFSRIICSRCCTRRNFRFHVVENSQHPDLKQLTRR